jgi:hypothetical protein
MRITFESFGAVNIIRFEGEAGPIKILFDAGDAGGIGITAAGQTIHIPPDSSEGEHQAAMEFMRTVRNTFSPVKVGPTIGRCDWIDSQIAAVALQLAELAEVGATDPQLEAKLQSLENIARSNIRGRRRRPHNRRILRSVCSICADHQARVCA